MPLVGTAVGQESRGDAAITAMGVDQTTGSMEGKEVRFGGGLTALWAASTTVSSNGSVNGMHDSLTPLGGLVPMIGMWLNNIFGGVGVGFINMLVYIIVAVFIASASANNGSGFEGLGDNTPFWNLSTGLVMLIGRYVPIIASLALAASLAAKPAAPETAGSLGADTVTFGLTLGAVVVTLGVLMFMPVAVLGPIAEHLS